MPLMPLPFSFLANPDSGPDVGFEEDANFALSLNAGLDVWGNRLVMPSTSKIDKLGVVIAAPSAVTGTFDVKIFGPGFVTNSVLATHTFSAALLPIDAGVPTLEMLLDLPVGTPTLNSGSVYAICLDFTNTSGSSTYTLAGVQPPIDGSALLYRGQFPPTYTWSTSHSGFTLNGAFNYYFG